MKLPAKRIVILGATSAIAAEVARRYAPSGSLFMLVARNAEKLKPIAEELIASGASGVRSMITDLRIRELHNDIVRNCVEHCGEIDVVIVAFGTLPDQSVLNNDVDTSLKTLVTNALSPISLAHRFTLELQRQGRGSLVILSSVAGDRGRRGNYAYGAAKAALTAYTAGLRGMSNADGVHVLTVKPGPVDTPMTAGKSMPLMAKVGPVADDIVRAIETKRLVIYTPGLWRLIMAAFKMLPERFAMKLKV